MDIIAILTDQPDYKKVRSYWKWLKNKLNTEGSEVVSITNQLKLLAPDGKKRLTDVVNTKQVFRIIQSIPSKKAEPFKLWLAEIAKQRLDQLQDPELSIEQAMTDYKRLGYSDSWINQRLKSIEIRKDLTNDMLAELSTKEISETTNPESFPEHEDVARRGGNIAKEARLKLEIETGKKVVSPLNAKSIHAIPDKMDEKDTKE